jgi:transcriptional regulator with XRE-family HTH domain
MQKVHIGKKIKARIEDAGMSVAEFARRLNRSSQSIYHVFNSQSIDTNLLAEISEVLNFNFFTYFVKEEGTEPKKEKKRRISLLIDIEDSDQQKAIFKTMGISLK